MRTFDEVFAEHRLTPEERTALVWHLAAFRARRTVEILLHPSGLKFTPHQHGALRALKEGDE